MANVDVFSLLSQLLSLVSAILSEMAVVRKQLADDRQQLSAWGDQLDRLEAAQAAAADTATVDNQAMQVLMLRLLDAVGGLSTEDAEAATTANGWWVLLAAALNTRICYLVFNHFAAATAITWSRNQVNPRLRGCGVVAAYIADPWAAAMVVALYATVDAVEVPDNALTSALRWTSNFFIRVRRGQTDNNDEVEEQPGLTATSLAVGVAGQAASTACSLAATSVASVYNKVFGPADAATATPPPPPVI
jgi:hypothetical protein